MLNSLDLLIYVFIGFAAVGLIGSVLPFITKNKIAQRAGLIGSALLTTVLGFANLESTPLSYGSDIFAGFLFAALAIAAMVLQFLKKDEKIFKIARILSAVSVLGGMYCTFMI